MAVAAVRPKPNIMKLKRNALARLKLQILFRLFFVCIALIPLVIAFFAWNWIPLVVSLLLMGLPAIILTFDPEFALGIFNTDRALSCVHYSGHFAKQGLDYWLTGPFSAVKSVFVGLVVLLFGWFFNLRSLVRISFDFQDIYRTVPRSGRRFSDYMKRFCQGLGLVLVLFIVWFAAVNLVTSFVSRHVAANQNPYVFQNALEDTDKQNVLENLQDLLHTKPYFYHVEIPFSEDGFDLGREQEEKPDTHASYRAEISHDVFAPNEVWEFNLFLNDDRSGWMDADDIVHPIAFDANAASTKLYLSRDPRGKITLMYQPRPGASYVMIPIDEAPEAYQTLTRYLLLPDEVLDMMQQDPDNLMFDGDEGLFHIVYQSPTDRVTIGMKDSVYPFEVSLHAETLGMQYETEVIRFDGTHSFTLPN
ncbi:MAG: hypothetical protein IKF50_01580 [Clostridia bacterium]|nr:hypothetical protein [Clostridia bacterium]